MRAPNIPRFNTKKHHSTPSSLSSISLYSSISISSLSSSASHIPLLAASTDLPHSHPT